jgi:hypothetical protein
MSPTPRLKDRRSASLKGVCLMTLLLLVLSSCSLLPARPGTAVPGGEMPDDGPPPPISRAAALSLVRKTITAGENALNTQTFTLTLTDSEVTSFLSIREQLSSELESLDLTQIGQLEGLEGLDAANIDIGAWNELLGQGAAARGGLPRLRPRLGASQVTFRDDGAIIARSTIMFLRWEIPVRLVTAPRASQGELVFEFIEGQIGQVKLPEPVFNLLTRGLAEVLLMGQDYAQITEIRVSSGVFTISGRYNR